jgi:hypothetical protein
MVEALFWMWTGGCLAAVFLGYAVRLRRDWRDIGRKITLFAAAWPILLAVGAYLWLRDPKCLPLK